MARPSFLLIPRVLGNCYQFLAAKSSDKLDLNMQNFTLQVKPPHTWVIMLQMLHMQISFSNTIHMLKLLLEEVICRYHICK